MTLYHAWWRDYKQAVEDDDNVGVFIMVCAGVGITIGFPVVLGVELIKRLTRKVIE